MSETEKKTTSLSGDNEEYIMKKGARYLLEVTNNKNEDCEVDLMWRWYEVDI